MPAAAVATFTSPGLRFFFDGQLHGARIHSPVQLGRWAGGDTDAVGQANVTMWLFVATFGFLAVSVLWAVRRVAGPAFADLAGGLRLLPVLAVGALAFAVLAGLAYGTASRDDGVLSAPERTASSTVRTSAPPPPG